MKRSYFIGLDVHCQFTELAVVTQTGQLTKRHRCPTTIPALREALEAIGRPRHVAFEEGPLADWLWRNLTGHVEELTVCDPRRNHLIAKDSDKDDPIDAEKLAQLLRGGYLKAVHHPETLERAVFKQLVLLYHDRVRQRVREANRVMAYLRRYGVFVKEKAFADPQERPGLVQRLPAQRLIASNLELLWQSYDLAAEQVRTIRRRLVEAAKKEEVIERFQELPGFGWVRAATFFVYVDTPWRFRSKAALWKYLGIGLERRHSGSGRVQVHLVKYANRQLKSVLIDRCGSEGDRSEGHPVCGAVPALAGGGTVGQHGPAQCGPQPGRDAVGDVEKWQRLPPGMGRCRSSRGVGCGGGFVSGRCSQA